MMLCFMVKIRNIITQTSFTSNITVSTEYLANETNSTLVSSDKKLETRTQYISPLYNQSCLFKNLYYVHSTFTILTIKENYLPEYYLRTDAFNLWPIVLNKREFDSYFHLEIFVRNITNPRRNPYVTLYFDQPWYHNIGYALFHGLYAAYVALIRFSPRHLHPFRILVGISKCDGCWSEDVYSRFEIIKQLVLNKLLKRRWFIFDEIIMGSGTFCQRFTENDPKELMK
ncbi:unnamed protein product [Adineta steineri]|uniref:Uncharacterized protein n=1 Tax=Adineta steineri TaxID=433720 RepID=A0A815PLF6_9BILA|nr:unnamed protein product [Adineta steineri]CAF3948794.1 unnamed protein product [Adineta steineri]